MSECDVMFSSQTLLHCQSHFRFLFFVGDCWKQFKTNNTSNHKLEDLGHSFLRVLFGFNLVNNKRDITLGQQIYRLIERVIIRGVFSFLGGEGGKAPPNPPAYFLAQKHLKRIKTLENTIFTPSLSPFQNF